ncbi:MAG: hypothetical protein RMX68_003305 [Aulosira sp. ZfuVER01]|nr:hypothetical protein [Aulosira sp. ZfuVER01]MDZ7997044.1 hypothetical protein [Aulosira sp. DedVER01a]MDZ8053073.1 hypothetical protein [Aulosira sp. ZfuCHP01]
MARRKPPNNGKPAKTEPGAIRINSNPKTENQEQPKKLDETN